MRGDDDRSTASRRAVVAAIGGLGLGAGCLGSDDRVQILSAGSLAVVLEDHVGPAFEEETGIAYEGEYHGANAVMRMVEDGSKHPDVVISADVELLRDRLYPDHADWDVEFAANEVGIAYTPETEPGARLEDGDPWYDVLEDADEGELAISDPDLDPLGYRAVHLFELAEREYGLDGFRDAMVERAYHEPNEPQLLSGIEAGNRACAVAYRNMAVDHDVPFLELPDAYNFGTPEYADRYAEASYTTDEGYETKGSPTVYNATVRRDADRAEVGQQFLSFLLENRTLLEEQGLRRGESLPRAHGELPEGIEP
ncbi:extracellular solute-binding protein [Natronococcus occultus]|uniref:ABC-type molybdate transport system, periplasmic component n=1 Tax=Natronococcus occultus SP4 TaxID=694430 RepID=L0JZ71_9EURY|nr:extracellular solute-binding protein [Natronococcus occultus]AGB37389.1 ABC-type molybdate transport system, periplasmic component [Natronococcus occultus SP4]